MNVKKMTQVRAAVAAPVDLAELDRLLRSTNETLVTIRPAVAEAILEHWNDGNRRRDELTVQKYRRAMSDGKWQDGHEIGFGVFEEGTVLGNGQHRLAAQVASGTTQTYRARAFEDHDEFSLYVISCDEGRVRSLSDMLQIFGVVDGSGAAKLYENVVNSMHAFYGGKPSRLTKLERFEFAKDYIKPIRYVIGLPKKTFRAHCLAAIALAYAKKPSVVEEVIAAAIGGVGLEAGSPAHAIDRNRQTLNDADGFLDKDRAIGLMLRALHDAASGRKKTAVHAAKSNASPVRDAIQFFCGKAVADAWVERQAQRRAK